VIVCDLMMPEVTGMDLYAELERSRPELVRRVVFMTGGALTARAREFLARVTNPRLEKPFDLERLRAIIAGLVAN
jgi:DNA-binding NtrC family response regulator